MQVQPRQLALALDHAESFARDDFIAGDANASALALIDRWPDWPQPVMALAGPEGAGKSHLAAIWAAQSGARVVAAHLLEDVGAVAALATGALVFEDAAPGQFDQCTLFHLLNLAREERAFVLLTCRTAPATWAVDIRDLASRLRAIPVLSVTAPGDDLLRALLMKFAADRQLEFDDSLIRFLTARIERSFSGARAAVAALDAEAMRRQRPVTRALAAELFRDGA